MTAAESPSGPKVVFVLFRRTDLTHDQSMAEWSGSQHTSIVRKIPGLKRWIQNHPMGARNEGSPDGIGELWFESAEAMDKAMKSAEMSAAAEDAKRFLDMTRTYALVVEEKTIVA
ncbi:MAG: EthD family reductase [Bradyrhizobium sp.]|nr:EthD family reductase [Bradyrhizobium sp.]